MSEIYLGNLLSDLDIGKPSLPVSGVYLKVDGETGYMAGDESGLVIECECPWGSAEMAYNILAKMKGFVYEPFSGTDALLDPAAELGDAITVGGHYGILATLGRNLNWQSSATVGAPSTDEIEDEYPYQSKQKRQTDRVLAKAYSRISKTAEEIRLEVVKKIDEDAANTLISAAIGKIELSVSSKNGSTSFVLTDGTAEISAQTLNLTVPAVNISGKLTASQIDADELVVRAANIDGTLSADQIVLTGSITWADLSTGVQEEIDDAWWMAYYAEQDFASMTYTYNGKVYIDESMIMAGTIIAGSLQGGEVKLLDADGNEAGVITLSEATTADYAVDIESYAGMRLLAGAGGIYIKSGYNSFIMLNNGEIQLANGDVRPSPAGAYSSGTASFYWADVYSENALIEVSDRNKKTDIVYGLDGYDAVFDGLQPVSFLFKDGTSGRRHPGLIAQDVEELLNTLGMDTKDFSPFVKAPRKDNDGNVVEGEYEYALRYGEFIALLIEQVQKLKKRVTALEGTS